MNDISENLAPKFHSEVEAMPLNPLPPLPPPPGKCASGTYFLPLLAMNGSLPAELKFRENTDVFDEILRNS